LHIANLEAERADRARHIVNLESERVRYAENLEQSALHIANLTTQLATLQLESGAQLNGLQQSLQSSQHDIAALETRLSATYRSTSWRLTKPLRAIKISWRMFIKGLT
jgi:hypothetical protein